LVADPALPIPEEPSPGEFDPADTVRRVAEALGGKRWPAVTKGDIEVISAEAVCAAWSISVRLTTRSASWNKPRVFLVELGWEDTFPGNSPHGNAQGLADNAMILIEEYLETGPVGRLIELTK
jgi:hypothetical protein